METSIFDAIALFLTQKEYTVQACVTILAGGALPFLLQWLKNHYVGMSSKVVVMAVNLFGIAFAFGSNYVLCSLFKIVPCLGIGELLIIGAGLNSTASEMVYRLFVKKEDN